MFLSIIKWNKNTVKLRYLQRIVIFSHSLHLNENTRHLRGGREEVRLLKKGDKTTKNLRKMSKRTERGGGRGPPPVSSRCSRS